MPSPTQAPVVTRGLSHAWGCVVDPHELTALIARAFRIWDLLAVSSGKASIADWPQPDRDRFEAGVRCGIRAALDDLAERGVIEYRFD